MFLNQCWLDVPYRGYNTGNKIKKPAFKQAKE
jgi:hypothetical protein